MNLSTIRENYMQNAAETRKLYAKYNNYTQKIQILQQYTKHRSHAQSYFVLPRMKIHSQR